MAFITGSLLVVAGGGGGGDIGGGGGAGGLIHSSTFTVERSSSISIVVGAGGVGGVYPGGTGTPGSSSSFNAIVAYGGGEGASRNEIPGVWPGRTGGSGGSGGGNSPGNTSVTSTTGSGTPGQGYGGGLSTASSFLDPFGGGGGGAGGTGSQGFDTSGGEGGVGLEISITGAPVYYAGGGGGNGGQNRVVSGGLGGGGAGGFYPSTDGVNGTNGLGGGGGGGIVTAGGAGDGGSGVVILSYPGSGSLLTGDTGSISYVSGNTIHVWDTVGSFSAFLTDEFSPDATTIATAVQATAIVASITPVADATVALSAIQASAAASSVEAVIPVGFQRNAFQNDAFYVNFAANVFETSIESVSATHSVEQVNATGDAEISLSSVEVVMNAANLAARFADYFVTKDDNAILHTYVSGTTVVDDFGKVWRNVVRIASTDYDQGAVAGNVKDPTSGVPGYFTTVAAKGFKIKLSGDDVFDNAGDKTAAIYFRVGTDSGDEQFIYTNGDGLTGFSFKTFKAGSLWPLYHVLGGGGGSSTLLAYLNVTGTNVVMFGVNGTGSYVRVNNEEFTGLNVSGYSSVSSTLGNSFEATDAGLSINRRFTGKFYEVYLTSTPYTTELGNYLYDSIGILESIRNGIASLSSSTAVSSVSAASTTGGARVLLDAITATSTAAQVEGIQLTQLDAVTATSSIEEVSVGVNVVATLDSVSASSEVSSFTATGGASTTTNSVTATSQVSAGVGADSRVELHAVTGAGTAEYCLAGGSVVGICPAVTATSTLASLEVTAEGNTEITAIESTISLEEITPHIDVVSFAQPITSSASAASVEAHGNSATALASLQLTSDLSTVGYNGSAATALSALQGYSSVAALLTLTRPGGDANPVGATSSVEDIIGQGYAIAVLDAVTGTGSTGTTPAFLAAEIDAVMAVSETAILLAKAFNPPRAPKVSDAVASVLPAGISVRNRNGGKAVGGRSRGFAKDE